MDLCERLISHAQNEEMIDKSYTEHGEDCLLAVKEILFLRAKIARLESKPAQEPVKHRYCLRPLNCRANTAGYCAECHSQVYP